MDEKIGKLYIVGTPIGNMEDMTFRAVRILGEVDFVFSEDTRVSGRLLKRYEIDARLKSLNAHQDGKFEYVKSLILEGKDIAYISDAGMPGISDPGNRLVRFVRSEIPESSVEVVPGPTAVTSALSLSGIDFKEFTFLGFLPVKKGRKTILEKISKSPYLTVFYESSHRIKKLMDELSNVLEEGQKVIVAKELTKIHENIIQGSPREIFEKFENTPSLQKGEFVVIVDRV